MMMHCTLLLASQPMEAMRWRQPLSALQPIKLTPLRLWQRMTMPRAQVLVASTGFLLATAPQAMMALLALRPMGARYHQHLPPLPLSLLRELPPWHCPMLSALQPMQTVSQGDTFLVRVLGLWRRMTMPCVQVLAASMGFLLATAPQAMMALLALWPMGAQYHRHLLPPLLSLPGALPPWHRPTLLALQPTQTV
jgi:hypothetical protein